jgi:hypothetical protein
MSTGAVTPLRHRMIEDMNARKFCAGTQRGHIHSDLPPVFQPGEVRVIG